MKAELVSDALNGRRLGKGYAAQCPLCNNEKATLSIWDEPDGLHLKCFYSIRGQCHPMALVFHLQTLGVDVSLGDIGQAGGVKHSETFHEIWHAGKPVPGSYVDDYLHSRGITLTSPALKCIDRLKHASGVRLPCMIATVTDPTTEEPQALHRTWLNAMGTGKADVVPNKMTLGKMRGGIIRLFEPMEGLIAIGEGIETCMSFTQLTNIPSWSAVAANNLGDIVYSKDIKRVWILGDNDEPGKAAADRAMANVIVQKLDGYVYYPEPKYKDFNDMLMEKVNDKT
jgi:hypothetical protein